MRILLVDDEKNIVTGIKAIIKANVDFATSIQMSYDGQHGYKTATTFKPDLVITDIRMHLMNG